MNSAVFNTNKQSYQVTNIMYAGPVEEIPEERRKTPNTHSFRLVTSLGAGYCYFRNFETATNARKALGGMLMSLKPYVFRSANQLIDPRRVVSFSHVFELKQAREDGKTHGFVVVIESADEKARKIWLTFQSEDHARKAQRALFAAIHSANDLKPDSRSSRKSGADEQVDEKREDGTAPKDNLPF